MEHNRLGTTDLWVPPLSVGAATFGDVYGAMTQEQANRTVWASLGLGLNFFDTAPYYGLTKSETVLGQALRGIPREAYILETKVGRYGAADFDFSYNRVLASVDESLARLGVEYLDIVLCHDIEFVNVQIIHEEALPALRTARDAGKVRYLGISGLPLPTLLSVIEREEDVRVVLSYCHLNLYDTTLLEILPLLQARGIGVIAASPLAMGLLSERPAPEWHPAPAELRAAVAEANRFCSERGVSLAQLAMQYAISTAQASGIATTLVGIARPEEVITNLSHFNSGAPDPELLASVQAIFAPVRNLTW